MITNKDGTVTLTAAEYADLEDDSNKLAALEAGGVDNWQWYDESLKEYWAEREAKENTEQTSC